MLPLLSGAIDAIAAMAMAMVSSGILNSSETGDTWHKNWWQKTEENGKEQKTRCCYFPVAIELRHYANWTFRHSD